MKYKLFVAIIFSLLFTFCDNSKEWDKVIKRDGGRYTIKLSHIRKSDLTFIGAGHAFGIPWIKNDNYYLIEIVEENGSKQQIEYLNDIVGTPNDLIESIDLYINKSRKQIYYSRKNEDIPVSYLINFINDTTCFSMHYNCECEEPNWNNIPTIETACKIIIRKTPELLKNFENEALDEDSYLTDNFWEVISNADNNLKTSLLDDVLLKFEDSKYARNFLVQYSIDWQSINEKQKMKIRAKIDDVYNNMVKKIDSNECKLNLLNYSLDDEFFSLCSTLIEIIDYSGEHKLKVEHWKFILSQYNKGFCSYIQATIESIEYKEKDLKLNQIIRKEFSQQAKNVLRDTCVYDLRETYEIAEQLKDEKISEEAQIKLVDFWRLSEGTDVIFGLNLTAGAKRRVISRAQKLMEIGMHEEAKVLVETLLYCDEAKELRNKYPELKTECP